MKILWTATALGTLDDVPYDIGMDILRGLQLAADFPGMHPERRRGRYRGYRWFPVASWLVFYDVTKQAIVIRGIRVGRGVRDHRSGPDPMRMIASVPRPPSDAVLGLSTDEAGRRHLAGEGND